MKKTLFIFGLLIFTVIGNFGQKIEKPTLTAKSLTEHQRSLLQEGVNLHNQKKFDAAILKYELILGENADATVAMYEKALSLYTKGDKEKTIETAVNGSKYRSAELPLFYMIIANVIDDVGKPKEAIKIYKDALEILEKEKDMERHISSLHFNLGITYIRQQMLSEARAELKKAVEYNPIYSSPHYVLSEIFGSTYKIPALLAAMRFISLEHNTDRTDRAVNTIKSVLTPPSKDEKTGNINIFMNLNAPKDEGDFGMYDLILGTLGITKDKKDKNKSAEELFADNMDTVIALLAEDKNLKSTFVGKQYVPYLAEMKTRGYSRLFSYIVIYKYDNNNANAAKWLESNKPKLSEFLNWAKTYVPVTK